MSDPIDIDEVIERLKRRQRYDRTMDTAVGALAVVYYLLMVYFLLSPWL